MNTRLHFRILYRQFLFRLMDVELLSSSAAGDSSTLLGQFGALLIFGSVGLSWAALAIGGEAHRTGLPGPVWAAERLMISLTMLMVGVFALLSWETTFPDLRDVLVLSPLPVRGRTLFAAKIAASGAALGITVAAFNCLSGFAWPLALAPSGCGFVGTLRFVAAFWIVLFAAATFVYCAVLTLQALAAQLPRAWYLRVSPALQIGAFVVFLGVAFFQPSINQPSALAAPENQRALAWLPSYWFMGLLSELSGIFQFQGHPAMAPLAHRAAVSLPIAIVLAASAFLLSHLRTLRKIVEEPDVAPGSRGGLWLPRFGKLPETALAHFAIRTALRSRQHRVVLGFYLGGGLAVAAVYLEGARDMRHLSWLALVSRANSFMMVATVIMLCALWLGLRTVFALPLDLRANWLFRVTPMPSGVSTLAAARWAMLSLSVLPIVAASVALFWSWHWSLLARHLLLLALFGSLLADLSLRNFRKIPFTCSYLPGKSKVHLLFWFGLIPAVFTMHKLVEWEQVAMASPRSFGELVLALAATALAARWISNAAARRDGPEIQFEDVASWEIVKLELNG